MKACGFPRYGANKTPLTVGRNDVFFPKLIPSSMIPQKDSGFANDEVSRILTKCTSTGSEQHALTSVAFAHLPLKPVV